MEIQEASRLFHPPIIAVVKTGSSILPWIENPHDTDFIVYADGNEGEWLADFYKLRPDGQCWFVDDIKNKNMRLFQYMYHYVQPVFGSLDSPRPDIFEYKEEYKRKLITQLGSPFSGFKYWYHVLTGIYMLENGEYTLTEEQIQNVRLCHDRKMTLDIYDYIQAQLLKYKQELDTTIKF